MDGHHHYVVWQFLLITFRLLRIRISEVTVGLLDKDSPNRHGIDSSRSPTIAAVRNHVDRIFQELLCQGHTRSAMFIDLKMVIDIALKLSCLEVDRIHLTSKCCKIKGNASKSCSDLKGPSRSSRIKEATCIADNPSTEKTRSTYRKFEIQFLSKSAINSLVELDSVSTQSRSP